jgi:hypothetical protein
MLLALALAQSQPASAAVTKYRSDGTGASAWWYNSCGYISIDVSDGSGAAGNRDYLYYDAYDDCAGTYAYGYGELPDGAVKTVQGGKEVSLSVDVSTLQGFEHYGTPLKAAITWKTDGTCSSKGASNGQDTYSYDGLSFTYRYNGKYSSSCADASGNVGGPASFSGTTQDAYIYSSRSISREFER